MGELSNCVRRAQGTLGPAIKGIDPSLFAPVKPAVSNFRTPSQPGLQVVILVELWLRAQLVLSIPNFVIPKTVIVIPATLPLCQTLIPSDFVL